MNIELKNIKYSQFASHETNCYQASIYVDGRKAGAVDNDGHGGEWMMGWPTGWSALTLLETGKCQLWQQEHFNYFQG